MIEGDEAMRAAFEAYILTDRPRERLERNTNNYKDHFVQEAWEAWCAALATREEWLPIEAAESEKDGRYILGWFEHDPMYKMYKAFLPMPDEPGPPWVAAVRYSGNDAEGWNMKGIGGLFPTKFRRITGPDGKPVGYIRPRGEKEP